MIISSNQYFYQCKASADASREECEVAHSHRRKDEQATAENDEDKEELTLEEDAVQPKGIRLTEQGLAALLESQRPWREENHAFLGVEEAKTAGIFPKDDVATWTIRTEHPKLSTLDADSIARLHTW